MGGTVIGLRDMHYALLTKDDSTGVTYSEPVKIPGAIQANINPNSSLETLFADDGPSETAASLGQIELEAIAKDFPLDVQAILLGHAALVAGVLKRKSGDTPPFVAFGFKSLKSNGKYRYVWLVKGKFQQPERQNETKGDTVNFQTPTMAGSFLKRDNDDIWIMEADEDDAAFVGAATWFTAATIGV